MSAPDRSAQTLLDQLRAVADQIEGHAAALYALRQEQARLRAALAQTGWKPDVRPQQGLLP
jgi:hypothetical protein